MNENYNVISETPSIVEVSSKKIDKRIDPRYYDYDYLKFEGDIYKKEELLLNCLDYFETGINKFNSGELIVKRLKTKNIQHNLIKKNDLLNAKVKEKNRDKFLKEEDIVLTTYGTGSIGKVAYINKNTNWVPDYTIAILRSNEKINSAYLMSFLNSKYGQNQIMRRVNGTTGITFVLKSQLKFLKIAMPSTEIQKYIGDKVRKAEKLREEAKTLREKAENELGKVLKSDSFSFNKQKYLFTNKVTERRIDAWYYKPIFERITDYLEKFTQIKRMNDIAKIGKGFSYSSNKELGNIPYLRISDIKNYRFDIEESLGIPERIYNKRKDKKLEKFDIVLAITGATIGKTAVVVKDDNEKMTLSADTAYLRVTNQNEIYPLYLLTFLKTKFGQLQIKQGITGATNRHLGLEDIASIKVPVIDIDKQKLIHDKILKSIKNENKSKQLIEEAKQDVEDLIEGNLEIEN